jgi:O-antigen ligase
MLRLLPLISTLLFLQTAMVGVLVAYDRHTAWIKLLLIVSGLLLSLGLAWFGKNNPENVSKVTGFASVVVVTCIGLYFVLLHRIPSGPTANSLVILMPLALGTFFWSWSRHHWLLVWLISASIVIAFVSLIMARERTAWLAMSAGLLGAAVMNWRIVSCRRPSWRWLFDGLLAGLGLCLLGYVAIIIIFTSQTFLRDLPIDPLTRRLPLWHDSLCLIQDYLFTGCGLGSTPMNFSSYVFLLHVPFQDQAHNLFLQIGIELGVPGLIAFLSMAIAAIWSLMNAFRNPDKFSHRAGLVTVASLIGMLVYGMFDSETYASNLVPVLFVPFGCAWVLGGLGAKESQNAVSLTTTRGPTIAFGAMILLLAGPCLLLLLPAGRARFLANVGATAQAQAELSVYKWPKWGLQDELRRSGEVDLSKAVKAYHLALAVDPQNVAANRRLGQIELARGDYQSAKAHLQMAYSCAPGQRATRQLLGEVYAITGNFEQAVDLWQSIDTTHGQLEVRQWWYESIGAQQELQCLTKAIGLLKKSDYRVRILEAAHS